MVSEAARTETAYRFQPYERQVPDDPLNELRPDPLNLLPEGHSVVDYMPTYDCRKMGFHLMKLAEVNLQGGGEKPEDDSELL